VTDRDKSLERRDRAVRGVAAEQAAHTGLREDHVAFIDGHEAKYFLKGAAFVGFCRQHDLWNHHGAAARVARQSFARFIAWLYKKKK
jgi:hypothetical protein